ncbi:MAG TPA: cytochrome c [Rhizomicrobium sp.]|nr:cytochrome c [Rhizomicrobium sp.]
MGTLRRFLLMAFAALGVSGAQAQTTHSAWNGVYTEAQAERGAVSYAQNCARCHGANLAGTFETPPLMGRFIPYWSGTTLDVLMEYLGTAMPLDRPGRLSRATNADIVAFILKVNGFPSGPAELSADDTVLRAIRFDAFKPASPPKTRGR